MRIRSATKTDERDGLLLATLESLGVKVDELASRRREPKLRELRELVAVLGVEKYGQQVREIAGRLKNNPGSVSRWVTTAAERRSSDAGFARRLGRLDEVLRGKGRTRDS